MYIKPQWTKQKWPWEVTCINNALLTQSCMEPRSVLKGLGVNEDLSRTFHSHSPSAVPLLDKATAGLCWPSSTACIPQLQHAARLRSQGCPCSPTFHSSFPRANPPQKRWRAGPAEPTPSSAHSKGRLVLDSKSTGLSHEPLRCPFPREHRCWT